jgi:hypothetical protein
MILVRIHFLVFAILMLAKRTIVNGDVLDGNVPLLFKQAYMATPVFAQANEILQVRMSTIVANAFFDALAPYTSKFKGIYSRIPRRPSTEWLNPQKNTAMAYAGLCALNSLFPDYTKNWQNLMVQIGLDPNDNSTNLTIPVGIGNFAGRQVVAFREQDGMNQLGDKNGNTYNRMMYADYTNYQSKNTAYQLVDPLHFQPLVLKNSQKEFYVQHHVCPQLSKTNAYTFANASKYQFSMPLPSANITSANYECQLNEILYHSASLNDSTKMLAEHFNNKTMSLMYDLKQYLLQKFSITTLNGFVVFEFGTSLALFDASIVTWNAKINYDIARPVTAAKVLYNDLSFRAWGGPGKGIVNGIKGKDWSPYLTTPAHSEYPSGTACFCAAQFAFIRRYLGTDQFGGYTVAKSNGSSTVEPGQTPATNIVLGPYNTFTDYVNDCGESRIIAGIHYRTSIDQAKAICTRLGNDVYDFLQSFTS